MDKISSSGNVTGDLKRASNPRKRKRSKVPEERRQRAYVACGSCRRLKEKCDGSIPCERCQRFGRTCGPAVSSQKDVQNQKEDVGDSERTRHLETIVRHFLGEAPGDTERLRKVVQALESDESTPAGADGESNTGDVDVPALDEEQFTVKPLSQSAFHYSGEFSHWNFSQRVRSQVDKRLQDATSSSVQEQFRILDHWRASHLQSRDTCVQNIRQNLPPHQVALFLVQVYFQFAQTISFFVEESWVLDRLAVMYTAGNNFRATDAPWLCTTLSVLAVGTQFAHLAGDSALQDSADGREGTSATDAVGVTFYRLAANLIPDMLTIASVECVQAFLMLAHYALPLDTQGLAYSYLGLALKMGVQNGMHRKFVNDNLDAASADLRNRLWWTTYKLEKRVSIFHGRPRSIACVDIDAEYPPDESSVLDDHSHSRKYENLMTKITDWLGDIAYVIQMLRRSSKRLRNAYFARLLEVRKQYVQWWPTIDVSRQVPHTSRAAMHVHLSHHLNLVFLGRPFMFNDTPAMESLKNVANGSISLPSKRTELVQDAVRSAMEIITLCSSLKSGIGMAKSSYIEFTSCRAAMLVLLAQSLFRPSSELRGCLAQGVELIQYCASANESTQSDASVVAACEAAIRLLDARDERRADETGVAVPTTSGDLTFEGFKKWASGLQTEQVAAGESVSKEAPMNVDIPPSTICDAFGDFDWTPFDSSIFDSEPFNTNFDELYVDDNFISNLAPSNLSMTEICTVSRRE